MVVRLANEATYAVVSQSARQRESERERERPVIIQLEQASVLLPIYVFISALGETKVQANFFRFGQRHE